MIFYHITYTRYFTIYHFPWRKQAYVCLFVKKLIKKYEVVLLTSKSLFQIQF